MARSRPLVAGNWKMNGSKLNLADLETLKAGIRHSEGVDVAVCPPATLISRASVMVANSPVLIGGQDCHPEASGAHTGDISAEMLADAGARMVIVGHSERRSAHDEDDSLVRAKAEAAWRAGLYVILCVGETEAERRAGDAESVVESQLDGSVPDGATPDSLVIAYEPVWAIGTGVTPTTDDIAAMHAHIRACLRRRFGAESDGIGILYGGSVKGENASAIFSVEGVDGALVGGASLKVREFLAIIAAAG
jgi:triosephosphate isomerase